MGELIINGGTVIIYPTKITGLLEAIIHCSHCGKKIEKETWTDSRQSPTYAMSPPEDCVRVIFGIHPEIYSSQTESVPAIFTPVYFCKECEEEYHIIASLLQIFLSFEPMIHPESNSQFDPERGCWITIWPLDQQSQPSWPIDYQVNLSTFREIAKKLMAISENPFCVFGR
ncbi:MAG: hypothetical protein ACD_7C00016G0005 [uncultured bacterium]|nr:MAG: hypothetical protein ACD_7C00016G0005 [uncultured bacterium]HBR79182.1 hypothetical protein [Candidatus Moranbacteria bacterium]